MTDLPTTIFEPIGPSATPPPECPLPTETSVPQPGIGNRLVQVLLTILLVPLLIGLSLQLLLLPPITHAWSDRFADVANAAVPKTTLLAAADAGLLYVAGGSDQMPRLSLQSTLLSLVPGNQQSALSGAAGRISFTPDVIAHMTDVRNVLAVARVITIFLAGLCLALGVILVKKQHHRLLSQALVLSALGSVLVVGVLVALGWWNFDGLFLIMHELLFTGNWEFSYDSLLICAYPLPFWMAMGATWAGLLLVFCLLALVVSKMIRPPQKAGSALKSSRPDR